ncbi:MAG: SdrD B-like domain-containing protein [Candidatus Promineifilaceae bacterium]|nr:SdrD B-like domain-containing protein [Candidatus Promineifilaceae bacterium]
MNRKIQVIIRMLLLLSPILIVFPIQAQTQTGSIRGTVYRDINENGICSTEGEARVGDIAVELVNDDTPELQRTLTAPDGTYLLANASLGLWRVTVVPGTGWRISSAQTREVTLTADQPDAIEVDFCIVQLEDPNNGGTTLPESGAFIAPPLVLIAIAGLLLMTIGAGLAWLGHMKK